MNSVLMHKSHRINFNHVVIDSESALFFIVDVVIQSKALVDRDTLMWKQPVMNVSNTCGCQLFSKGKLTMWFDD